MGQGSFRAGGDGVHVSPQKVQRLQNFYARWGSVFGGALAKPLVVVLTQKAYGFRWLSNLHIVG